jgi:hypothetical protein
MRRRELTWGLAGMAGIGASFPFPLAPAEVG